MWCVRRTRRLDGQCHETWCRPRASLGCATVVAAAVEADLGTMMVDLRRMTLAIEKKTPSTANGWSSWMVAATLPAVAQAAKYCRVLTRNVRTCAR